MSTQVDTDIKKKALVYWGSDVLLQMLLLLDCNLRRMFLRNCMLFFDGGLSLFIKNIRENATSLLVVFQQFVFYYVPNIAILST